MIRSHSSQAFPASKMLPVEEALRSSRERWGRGGRRPVLDARRMTAVIATLKKRHRKRARGYARKLCQEIE